MKKIVIYDEVCKDGILQLIRLKKEYEKEREEKGRKNLKKLKVINNYIDEVINKDKSYYSKISKMVDENIIPNEDIKYLL